MDKTYAFNFKFTRADENHENVYEVGFNVSTNQWVTDEASAERWLRQANDHLTILEVSLFAIMNEDGDILYRAAK